MTTDFEDWDPADHILPDLIPLVIPIDSVHPMAKDTNPQRGDVEGIAAAMKQYKQHALVVARKSDGVILKGNNTWDAARNILGWPGIAVAWADDDDTQALGRMMSDNITSMRAHQDHEVFAAIMPEVVEYYPEVFEQLGYDPYEMAALEESHNKYESTVDSEYVPPIMIVAPPQIYDPDSEDDEQEPSRLEAAPGIDQASAVVTGSPGAVPGSSSKAILNYTLVFDSPEQQQRWYAFMRFIRSDPSLESETFVAKLTEFNERYAEF